MPEPVTNSPASTSGRRLADPGTTNPGATTLRDEYPRAITPAKNPSFVVCPKPVSPGERRASPILLPPEALLLASQLMADGQDEHGDRWTRHDPDHHVDRALSHALLWLAPGVPAIDTDSGYSHLVNAFTRLGLAVALEHRTTKETR